MFILQCSQKHSTANYGRMVCKTWRNVSMVCISTTVCGSWFHIQMVSGKKECLNNCFIVCGNLWYVPWHLQSLEQDGLMEPPQDCWLYGVSLPLFWSSIAVRPIVATNKAYWSSFHCLQLVDVPVCGAYTMHAYSRRGSTNVV